MRRLQGTDGEGVRLFEMTFEPPSSGSCPLSQGGRNGTGDADTLGAVSAPQWVQEMATSMLLQ